MIDGNPVYADELLMLEYQPIRNNHGGLMRFGEACRLGKEVKEGEELVRIVDYFDNTLECIKVPFNGVMVAIPAQVVLPSGGCQIGSIAKIIKRVPCN